MAWVNARIIADAQQADALGDALMEAGALSVTVEDADAGTPDETPQYGEPGMETQLVWARSVLSALFDAEQPVADIVAAFNALYDANLDISDYDEAASAPVPDDDGENFTLVADANSLAYKGQIVIVVRLATVALSTVITTTNLDGLEFPPA